jgi:ABC-type Na+ transport system ATPase subunit NatA
MIEVHDLRKQYGDLVAVDEVSFVAGRGRVFGLLGLALVGQPGPAGGPRP